MQADAALMTASEQCNEESEESSDKFYLVN